MSTYFKANAQPEGGVPMPQGASGTRPTPEQQEQAVRDQAARTIEQAPYPDRNVGPERDPSHDQPAQPVDESTEPPPAA